MDRTIRKAREKLLGPEIVEESDYTVLKYRARGRVFTVAVDNMEVAKKLLGDGPWHVKVNRTGKEYLVHGERVLGKKSPRNTYAHRLLFGDNVPRDGDHLNLRAQNFQPQAPRTVSEEELKHYRRLLWARRRSGLNLSQALRVQARYRLRDKVKAQDCYGAVFDVITDPEVLARKTFANDRDYWVWAFKIFDVEARKRKKTDIVLDREEQKLRRVEPRILRGDYPAGTVEADGEAESEESGLCPSPLAPGWIDNRPARSKRAPKPDRQDPEN